MKLPTLNGKTHITLTIAGILTALGAMFSAGMAYQDMRAHTRDTGRHESPAQKMERIDSRVDLHLKPIEERLRAIERSLDRLERVLERRVNEGTL